MRLAITIGQDAAGKWTALKMPEEGVEHHKTFLDKATNSQGKVGKQQFVRIIMLTTTGQVKKRKFNSSGVEKAAKIAAAIQREAEKPVIPEKG